MMKIESIKTGADRAGRHWVTFSDGSRMGLYRQTVEDFGLFPGLELSDEAFDKLKKAAGAMSAKMRAVRIVAAASVSQRDLQQRLVQKGEDPEQAAAAVAWMSEMKLVDDAETARQIVARCAARGYGIERARQMLYEKKIPKQYWDAALAEFPDQTQEIIVFLRGKNGLLRDPKQQKKVIDALMRRGHRYSEIRAALRQLDLDADDFPEE